MAPILDEFERTANTITYNHPRLRLISCVTGELATTDMVTSASYWRDHIMHPVQFAKAINTLHRQDYKVFVEVGAHPTLLTMGQNSLPENCGLWVASLRKKHDDWEQMLSGLGSLYLYGIEVDWIGFDRDYAAGDNRQKVHLPTYPFQHKRYWIPETPRRPQKMVSGKHHPLLGRRLRSALKEIQFESTLTVDTASFLRDHQVGNISIMPTTGYLEIAIAAARAVFNTDSPVVRDLIIQEPLELGADNGRVVQTVINSESDDQATLQIFSTSNSTDVPWQLHATAQIVVSRDEPQSYPDDINTIKTRCTDEISSDDHYQALSARSLHFGPSLRGVQSIWRREGEALGKIRVSDEVVPELEKYNIHPALLDSCLQVLSATTSSENSEAYLPLSVGYFCLYSRVEEELWSHAYIQEATNPSNDTLMGNIHLLSNDGRLVGEIRELTMRRAKPGLERREHLDEWLYTIQWLPQPASSPALPESKIPLTKISSEIQVEANQLSKAMGLEEHHQAIVELESLSSFYIVRALQGLGWKPDQGEQTNVEDLARKLGILEQYHRLIARYLSILTEDGLLKVVEDANSNHHWEVVRPLEIPALELKPADLLAKYPRTEPQITLTKRCGEELTNILRGTVDPLQILFPSGSLTYTEALYQSSPEAQVYNTLAQKIVAAIASSQDDRPLRILEIGAGTGSTTAAVLPTLPTDSIEYLFTDISTLFLNRAKEKFIDYPFIRYQLLNIEQDPATQGVKEHQFDIVIAVNVLHATADLRQSLNHIRQLLAPDGVLLVTEATAPERWIDLTFGLTDGWWRFTDTNLRPSYPLLTQQQWTGLLRELNIRRYNCCAREK